ncbi:unnamed protein product [Phytophthora lilii]|uniref:Unnamed protein product n=1 Tax=Phytophthora lilii TaxID=2077276 RepID=A0A9W6X406_9STRA|nr:unnamed protein product [Phytophthora lilii]
MSSWLSQAAYQRATKSKEEEDNFFEDIDDDEDDFFENSEDVDDMKLSIKFVDETSFNEHFEVYRNPNHSAFEVFTNYSYDIMGFTNIVPEAINYLNNYAISNIREVDEPLPYDLWVVFLKICMNPYVITMIGAACTDKDRYYQEFDRNTYEGDLMEEVCIFLDHNNFFNTPKEKRYIFERSC